MTASQVHWTPRPDHTAVAKFIVALRERGVELPAPHDAGAFRALHRWSIEHPDAFWRAVWLDAQVLGTLGEGSASAPGGNFGPPVLAGPRWFPEARLNFAENLLRHAGTAPAIVSWDERGAIGEWSRDRLRAEVSRVAAGFRALGLQPGDRVAGWLPNIAEAVIAMLATASIGGVWTSCSPDFGVEGIVDRFGQTEPGRARRGIGAVATAVRAAAVRPSALHPLFVGNHGTSQMPGARCWRDTAAASQGAPASR
jgi:acetoacetyl-CoA synthetase